MSAERTAYCTAGRFLFFMNQQPIPFRRKSAVRILIKNGTIVNANGRERKDILTDGDRIIAMGGNLDAAGAEVIDAAAATSCPAS